MAEDLISRYIDQAAFEADTKFAIEQINLLETKYKEAKTLLGTLFTATGLQNISGSATSAATSITSLTDAINKQTSTINQNKAAQNDLTDSSKKLAAEKTKLAQLHTEEAKQLAAVKLQQQQATQANKDAAKAAQSAAGSYNQLNLQLKALQERYKSLSETERSSPVGKGLLENIQTTKTSLKNLDESLGDHERKVGSYADAIGEHFAKIVERVLEYTLAYTSIEKITEFFKGTADAAIEAETAAFRFKGTLDNLGRLDAFERLKKSAEALHEEFQFFENPQIIGVFEQLVTFGKLSENQINELTPVIINFAAKSGLSLKEATSSILAAIEGQGKGLKQYGINIKDAKTEVERFGVIMNELAPKVNGAAAAFGETTQGNIEKTKIRFKELQEEIGNKVLPTINGLLNGFNNILKDLDEGGISKVIGNTIRGIDVYLFEGYDALKKYQQLQKDIHAGVVGEDGKPVYTLIQPKDTVVPSENKDKPFDNGKGLSNEGKAGAEKSLQELKDRLSAEFEIYKGHQQEKIKLFDRATSDDKVYYTEKLTALDNFIKASKELNDKQEANDIEKINRDAEREIRKLKDEKTGKSPAQIERINKNIETIQYNSEQAILKIIAAAQDKQGELIQTGADKRQKIVEDQLQKEKDDYEEHQKEVDLFTKDPKKDADIAKRLKDAADQEIQILKEKEELKKQILKKSEDLLFEIASAGFDRKNNILEAEKDAIDKKAQHDIEVVNASNKSDQDKAAAVVLINARLAAQKEAIDRKEKQNNLKKAQFERGEKIFEIGIETIKAIFAIKAKAAAAFPAGAAFLTEIPLVLASSALSIAAILAQPLPKFKHGKNNDYEGLAIVGDGGVPEYIRRADGTIEKTPARDTLTYLGKTDVVFPNMMDFMIRNSMPSIRSVNGNKDYSFERLESVIKSQTPLLQKIANKRENHISAKVGSLASIWQLGSSTNKYLDESTNW